MKMHLKPMMDIVPLISSMTLEHLSTYIVTTYLYVVCHINSNRNYLFHHWINTVSF